MGGRRSRSGWLRRYRYGRARDRHVTHAYRKRIVDTDPALVSDPNALLEPIIAGQPDDSPLRWTSKSVSKLTAELRALGHALGRRVVNELLHHLGYMHGFHGCWKLHDQADIVPPKCITCDALGPKRDLGVSQAL